MQKSDFRGVLPAITTKMTEAEEVDFAGVAGDVEFQIAAGVDAIIVCGSLGEASTLTADEKLGVARAAIEASGGRKPVLLTIAEDSTRAGARLAEAAARAAVSLSTGNRRMTDDELAAESGAWARAMNGSRG